MEFEKFTKGHTTPSGSTAPHLTTGTHTPSTRFQYVCEATHESLLLKNSSPSASEPHEVYLSAATGSVSFTHHSLNFQFSTLNTTSHTVDAIGCTNLHHVHEVKNCEQCAPMLNALFAVKEIEELQFGMKDWSDDDDCCGWACDFALNACTFWHFASPQHLSRKYSTPPILVDKLMEWVHSLTPADNGTEDLDYHKNPFGKVFLTPEDHFAMLVEYLKTINFTISPRKPVESVKSVSVEGEQQEVNPQGNNTYSCEHSTQWKYAVRLEDLQCLQTKSGYESLGKLMISPRFVVLVLQLLPNATIEDIFVLRESYLQTTTPTSASTHSTYFP